MAGPCRHFSVHTRPREMAKEKMKWSVLEMRRRRIPWHSSIQLSSTGTRARLPWATWTRSSVYSMHAQRDLRKEDKGAKARKVKAFSAVCLEVPRERWIADSCMIRNNVTGQEFSYPCFDWQTPIAMRRLCASCGCNLAFDLSVSYHGQRDRRHVSDLHPRTASYLSRELVTDDALCEEVARTRRCGCSLGAILQQNTTSMCSKEN